MTTVVVFGGTGFLGRRLVHRLATEGAIVRVAVRHPDEARNTLPAADLAQVTILCADVRDQASVATAITGADAVVNAVSAYVEKGGATFEAVHVQGAANVARESSQARRRAPGTCVRPGRGFPVAFSLHPFAGARRTGSPAGFSERHHCPPECHVRSGRRAVRHAHPSCPAASGAAADRWRSYASAAGLC